jgi:hypothetical protein
MAERGVAVKAFEACPVLSQLETLYHELFVDCGGNADSLLLLAPHYGLEGSELFDAIRVIRAINYRVNKNADNRSRPRQLRGNKRPPKIRKGS